MRIQIGRWLIPALLMIGCAADAARGQVSAPEEGGVPDPEAGLVEDAESAVQPWVPEVAAPQYFAVSVTDVDRSMAWYRDVLGLREIGGAKAEDGAWRIENLRSDVLFVEIIRDDRDTAVERAQGFAKVGFFVPDIEDVADRVAASTGERPRVLDFERFELRLLQLRDPDDNVLQIMSPMSGSEPSDTE